MTITASRTGPGHEYSITDRVLVLIAAALTLVVAVALTTWQRVQSSIPATNTTIQVSPVPHYESGVYAPGGSVYGEQVPPAARADLSAYAPGGSVYAEQVPPA
jgi:hypothetical protein